MSLLLQKFRRVAFWGAGESWNWNAPAEFTVCTDYVRRLIADKNIPVFNDPWWIKSMGTRDGWHLPADLESKRRVASYICRLVHLTHFLSSMKEVVTMKRGFRDEDFEEVLDENLYTPSWTSVQERTVHTEMKGFLKFMNYHTTECFGTKPLGTVDMSTRSLLHHQLHRLACRRSDAEPELTHVPQGVIDFMFADRQVISDASSVATSLAVETPVEPAEHVEPAESVPDPDAMETEDATRAEESANVEPDVEDDKICPHTATTAAFVAPALGDSRQCECVQCISGRRPTLGGESPDYDNFIIIERCGFLNGDCSHAA